MRLLLGLPQESHYLTIKFMTQIWLGLELDLPTVLKSWPRLAEVWWESIFSVASLKPYCLRDYVTILKEHWLGLTQYNNMQAWLAKIDELFISLSGFIVVIHDKQNSVFWWQESARGGKISQAALFLKTGGMVESVLHLSPPARNASTLNPGANRSMQSNKWQMLIQRDR